MLLFEHRDAGAHRAPSGHRDHPDDPSRIEAIEAALAAHGWPGLRRRAAPSAGEADLLRVHTPDHIARIAGLSAGGGGAIDADTFVVPGSYMAACNAAGAACALARALMAGEDTAGFSVTRPAGHHAEPDRAMGFCLFNNVALAAQTAIAEGSAERVAIIDWDVHHGNGTEAVFRRRADVLVAGIHQAGLFPGTGAVGEAGVGAGLGYTLNAPVPAGSDGEVWLSLLEHVIVPVVREFAPALILVSAGFDAHREDPIGGCRLETDDFGQMACHVRDLARELGVPVGAVLEGGYNPPALAASVLATVRALDGAGEADSIAPDPIVTPRIAAHVGHFWTL
jgi:acetoin utilization deacetylase AcuC-like enzyme